MGGIPFHGGGRKVGAGGSGEGSQTGGTEIGFLESEIYTIMKNIRYIFPERMNVIAGIAVLI